MATAWPVGSNRPERVDDEGTVNLSRATTAEETLMESGLEYLVVGPTAMTDEPAGTRKIRLIPRTAYVRGMTVTRGDTAAVVTAAGLPASANRTFSVLDGEGAATPVWRGQFEKMPRR